VTRPTPSSVIVLGGGLAGLTAAYRLASNGLRITLIEQRSALGGNAIQSDKEWEPYPLTISNSHDATWNLLRSLGSGISPARLPQVPLEFLMPDGTTTAYQYTPLPQPLHVLVSLFRFNGLAWPERWRLVSWLEQIWEGASQLPSDLAHRTADAWLATLGQGERARETIWNPLARWLTGNQLTHQSADTFRQAIEQTFLRSARESRWAIVPSVHASLLRPTIETLRASGVAVLLDTEAAQVLSDGDHVTGVLLKNGSTLQGDWYLAALPPHRLAGLLPERWLSRYAYFQQFAELMTHATISAQIIIRQSFTKPRILLLSRGFFYSIVAQSDGSNHTVCRFSGGGDERVDSITSDILQASAEEVLRSVTLLAPGQTVESFDYRRNEEGCLSLEPGAQLRRPLQRSPIANLLVSGAWTDTGWPPNNNMESAIVSADRCVEIVHGSLA